MLKLPRTIRLDPSDTFVFERAANPGEWAVSGTFMFRECNNRADLDQKQRVALRPSSAIIRHRRCLPCSAASKMAKSASGFAIFDAALHGKQRLWRMIAEEGRKATRCFWSRSARLLHSRNMKVPETAHSPGFAARSNTNVSDGSSLMVRGS